MSLKVGILGIGQAGQRQAIGFSQAENSEITAIFDINKDKADKTAKEFKAIACTKWQDMFELGIDILVIATPHNLHIKPAIEAAGRGTNIMMEKPLATNMKDSQQIVDICKANNVKLATSHVHRFREEVQIVKQWITSGKIGDIMMIRETMNGQKPNPFPQWLNSKEIAGGGVFMYGTIHGLDRIRWYAGSEISEIYGKVRYFSEEDEVEDGGVATLQFKNGIVASVSACSPGYPAQPSNWDTEIYGTRGLARLRVRGWAELSNNDGQKRITTSHISDELGIHYNFVRQAEDFNKAIIENHEPSVTGFDGLKSTEMVLKIYESNETGKPVKF